jgi:hypothetical protein
MKTYRYAFVFAIAVLPPFVRAATVYDAAGDFSATNNPNGVWRYGYKSGSGVGPFTLFVNSFQSLGVDFWYFPSPPPFGALPQVAHNPTTSTEIFGTGIVAAGEMTFHPGESGELAVVRFTAPAAGNYGINALFQNRDTLASSADVSILAGATPLFVQTVSPAAPSATFQQTAFLSAGQTLDFQLGEGSFSYFNDNKRISAVITFDAPVVVPEPWGLLMVGSGLALVAWHRLRSRDPKRETLSSSVNS